MEEKKKIDTILLLTLIGMLVATFFLWNTPIVYPVKIFVVLLHELSHGLAAILTGGRIVSVEVNADQGGLCTTVGGFRFLILIAGYLGSLFWGALILFLSSKTKADKILSMAIGVITIAFAILFVRNLFGFIFCLVFGGGLVLIGFFAPMVVNDFILKFIGLCSILYVFIDILDDLILNTFATSDASRLATEYFGFPVFWGVLWMAIAALIATIFLKAAILVDKKKED